MPARFCYMPKHLTYLCDAYRSMSLMALTDAFNANFGTDLSRQQIRSALRNHRIRSGRTGRFESDQIPWNKGVKGLVGANSTSYKPGNIPHNRKELWSERISRSGYVEICVPRRNPYTGSATMYMHKHVWLWEMFNGPRPPGTAVIFRDGNTRNMDLDNLLLVTRAELLVMNLHNYKHQPDELKDSVRALARLESKAGIRTRPGNKRKIMHEAQHE